MSRKLDLNFPSTVFSKRGVDLSIESTSWTIEGCCRQMRAEWHADAAELKMSPDENDATFGNMVAAMLEHECALITTS